MAASRPRTRNDFEIAVICALPLEAEAVVAMFDYIWKDDLGFGKVSGDTNVYTTGTIGRHHVVMAHMPGAGKRRSTNVASNMRFSFPNITLALVVGICGGVPDKNNEIILGDVIISKAIVEYDNGKQLPDKFATKNTLSMQLGGPNREIESVLAKLQLQCNLELLESKTREYLSIAQKALGTESRYLGSSEDKIFKASYHHKHRDSACEICFANPNSVCDEALSLSCKELRCDERETISRSRLDQNASLITSVKIDEVQPSIHIGVIACADMVMKSGQHRDQIAARTGAIAVEMEGAGVCDILPCLVIKAICDYADSHKNKYWQRYAAATAASCMKAFLDEWSSAAPREPAAWLVPFNRNPDFVGRNSELEVLEKNLFTSENVSNYTIFGLGGMGKTQVALELAYRTRDKHPDCLIIWVASATADSLHQAYLDIGKNLKIPGVESEDADINLVTQYLSQETTGKWLMIFDNADDIDTWFSRGGDSHPLVDYVPRSSQGRAVLTTRDEKVAIKFSKKDNLRLKPLDESTSIQMFQKLLIREEMVEDHQVTTQLLEQLCFLPLAIVQAAAYLNENHEWISISDYLNLLSETEGSLIELLTEDFEDDRRYPGQKNPVATTWLVSFQHIQQRRPLAVEYLSFISCVDPQAIPISLLPPVASKKEHLEALSTLTAYSFVTRQPNETLDIHRLVHEATRNWLKMNKYYVEWVAKTRDRVAAVFPSSPEHENRQIWRSYLPHAMYVLNLRTICDQKDSCLMYSVGDSLRFDGRYQEAEGYFARALQLKKIQLGPEHPDTLTTMSHLTHILSNVGRDVEAADLGEQVLELRKKVVGKEYPDTFMSIVELAIIYFNQGRHTDAVNLGNQAVELLKKVPVVEDPITIEGMLNASTILLHQGRRTEAIDLIQQTIKLCNKAVGIEHPYTLQCMNNLGAAYYEEGRYSEAAEFGEQTLELCEKVCGEDHPNTLVSMKRLALTRKCQGRDVEAVEMMAECVRLSKEKLPEGHFRTKQRIELLELWRQK